MASNQAQSSIPWAHSITLSAHLCFSLESFCFVYSFFAYWFACPKTKMQPKFSSRYAATADDFWHRMLNFDIIMQQSFWIKSKHRNTPLRIPNRLTRVLFVQPPFGSSSSKLSCCLDTGDVERNTSTSEALWQEMRNSEQQQNFPFIVVKTLCITPQP